MRVAIAMLVAGLVLAAQAADEQKSKPADKDNFFKRTAKVIGHDPKTGAKDAGQSAKQTGKAVGHGTAKAVTDIGHAMKESAKKTKKAAQDTFK